MGLAERAKPDHFLRYLVTKLSRERSSHDSGREKSDSGYERSEHNVIAKLYNFNF